MFLGFCFVLLFSLAVTFLHSCSGNFSITAARNAWVGYYVCLCYGVQESRDAMDGGGGSYIGWFGERDGRSKHKREYEEERRGPVGVLGCFFVDYLAGC